MISDTPLDRRVTGFLHTDPNFQVVRQLSSIQATIQAAADKPAPAAAPPSLGSANGKRVASNPDTLRKIWDLIENQDATDAPDTETIIEVPER